MPSGSNPNSRKALEKNREKTQFCGEIAVKMQKKSVEKRKLNASLKEGLRELLTDDKVLAMCDSIIESAISGDLRAFREIRETLSEVNAQDISESTDNRIILVERLDDLDE